MLLSVATTVRNGALSGMVLARTVTERLRSTAN
jgi:hypothetical protein